MDDSNGDAIGVDVPARTINMAIVRTVAAAVAARADLTVDQVEDVRLAIDEAMAHLIQHASPDASIHCDLRTQGASFDATLSCPTTSTTAPEPEPFSWTVLTALVGNVDLTLESGELRMHWSVARDHSVSA